MSKLFFLFGFAAAQNLIVNGDFELYSADYCSSSWCFVNDQKAISPWTITSNYKEFELDNTPWQAQSGKWSMDLCSNAAYTISQSVPTQKGKRYKLTFYLNQNDCEAFNKTGFFSIGDDRTGFYYNSDSFSGWRLMGKEFVASSSTTLVSIGATNQGTCGPVVDNVFLKIIADSDDVKSGTTTEDTTTEDTTTEDTTTEATVTEATVTVRSGCHDGHCYNNCQSGNCDHTRYRTVYINNVVTTVASYVQYDTEGTISQSNVGYGAIDIISSGNANSYRWTLFASFMAFLL